MPGSWLYNGYIVHRGFHDGSSDCPENSMASFDRAIKEGFAIELDIRMLKDNKIIVFHDDNFKRMVGYNKNVSYCKYRAVKKLKLMDGKERVPLLGDVLEQVNGKVPLLIDIKNDGVVGDIERYTYELLKNYKGEFAIQSFNPYTVGWYRSRDKNIVRGQLSGTFKDSNMAMYKKFILKNLLLNRISKPHFINYEIKGLNRPLIKLLKLSSKAVLGWTSKNRDEFHTLRQRGINTVFEGFDPRV